MWANEFELGHPVLSDNDYKLSKQLWPDSNSRPKEVLLGPGGEILTFDVTEERIAEEF